MCDFIIYFVFDKKVKNAAVTQKNQFAFLAENEMGKDLVSRLASPLVV